MLRIKFREIVIATFFSKLDPSPSIRRPSDVGAPLEFENDLIFISIASYRDAQLLPTIRDCILKARRPERLRFGICWQHGPNEGPLPFSDYEEFRILDVDWRESRGACWARSEIMKLWQGEAFFLQVDSHCRFASSWDEKLIAEMALTGSAQPILSTYATAFTPESETHREILAGAPHLMAIQSFTPEGLPLLKPVEIRDWRALTRPLRARFLAAGFLFTLGQFVEEVGYDPELYFFGEEIAMTVRAFTHGYDLFHPRETLVWHDYVRSYAKRHWDDHTPANQVKRDWNALEEGSREKVKRLLSGEPVEGFGLGAARTLAQYESYACASCRITRGGRSSRLTLPQRPAGRKRFIPGWCG
jgi:hypothetical protein